MARYANVDIKIKGKHEDLLEAALFLKNHYDANDFKEMDHGVKLFSYIEQSFELGSDDGVRQLISKLTSIVPNISLNAVGIWENPETKEYQDFFYKYKNQELYVQTSDIYGKEKIDEEMTYEEFCQLFDIDINDENAITESEFKVLMGNEVFVSASGEYIDDLD